MGLAISLGWPVINNIGGGIVGTPKRDYSCHLYVSEVTGRGRLVTDQQILFFTSDKNTSNIYFICDALIDFTAELIFAGEDKTDHKLPCKKVDDRLLEVEIPQEQLQQAGTYSAQLLLTIGDKVLTTNPISFTIKNSVLGGGTNG